jgi:F-type H+-transporting ATPase subunit a
VSGQSVVLAADVPFPPSVEDFFPPSILPWGEQNSYWFTKISLLVFLSMAAIIIFFLVTYRKPKLVPTKKQWIAESVYGFVRNNISVDMLGHKAGVRFAPYFTTLFCFVFLNNLWSIIPIAQISPNSHIAFPAFLAAISYVMFIAVGIRKHGFVKYMRNSLVPPAPWFILPLLIPIEFFSNFLVRPFSLAVRLFANMLAGHLLLVTFAVLSAALFSKTLLAVILPLPFVMLILLTGFEILVAGLQAFIFTILTAVYIGGAMHPEH